MTAYYLSAVINNGYNRIVIDILRLPIEKSHTDAPHTLYNNLVATMPSIGVVSKLVTTASVATLRFRAVTPVDYNSLSIGVLICELKIETCRRGHFDLDDSSATSFFPKAYL